MGFSLAESQIGAIRLVVAIAFVTARLTLGGDFGGLSAGRSGAKSQISIALPQALLQHLCKIAFIGHQKWR
jgi:hypothetical protein